MEKFKNVLLKLHSELNGDMLIGGSLSLKLYGVIDRDINDLDLCIEKELHQVWSDFFDNISYNRNDYNELENCDSFEINEIVVDIFSKCKNYGFKEIELFGITFKVADPIYSIKAKIIYLQYFFSYGMNDIEFREKAEKHINDIQSYNNWLKSKIK